MISMKLLFPGKTLSSDEPNLDNQLAFRDFIIDNKFLPHGILLKFTFCETKFWQNKKL